MAKSRYGKAAKVLGKMVSRNDDDLRLLELLGKALAKGGQREGAASISKSVLC